MCWLSRLGRLTWEHLHPNVYVQDHCGKWGKGESRSSSECFHSEIRPIISASHFIGQNQWRGHVWFQQVGKSRRPKYPGMIRAWEILMSPSNIPESDIQQLSWSQNVFFSTWWKFQLKTDGVLLPWCDRYDINCYTAQRALLRNGIS